MTPTVLSSGIAMAALLVFATGVSGATPKKPIYVGDVIRGAARITLDDGSGGIASGVQAFALRCRCYDTGPTSQWYNDWDAYNGSLIAAGAYTLPVDIRAETFASPSPIASATVDTAIGSGHGLFVELYVETTTLAPIRVRLYAPDIRVISGPQPLQLTAGASPYTWQNLPQPFVAQDFVAIGAKALVTVAPGAGGTISQIQIGRGATSAGAYLNATTGLTGLTGGGTFLLNSGDGITVTWATTAAVLTVTYL